jgi:ABC-type dipeptide/oligopeptide/nickel transport system ATPase subunit
MEPLVEIRDVHKVYRRDQFNVPVLNGVTLGVPRGDFLALMGRCGLGNDKVVKR